jgi:hypothetical protein
MGRIMITPGLRYGALAFAAGAALGPLRELLLAPRVGATLAALAEALAMALLLWLAARHVVGQLPAPNPDAALPVPNPSAALPVPNPSAALPVPNPGAALPVPNPGAALPVPTRRARLLVAGVGVAVVVGCDLALSAVLDMSGLAAGRAPRDPATQAVGLVLLAWLAAMPLVVHRRAVGS